MIAPAGYRQLPSGFWVRDDGSGPYFINLVTGEISEIGSAASGTIYKTAAEIAALAAVSGLVAGGMYFDSETGIFYLASSSSAYEPLSSAPYIGSVTFAVMLAYSSPAVGMLADVTNLGNIVSRWRYNGSYWTPLNGRQQIYSILADTYNATADGTERLIPNCQVEIFGGVLPYVGAAIEVRFGVERSASGESPLIFLRFGTTGSSADTLLAGSWTLTTGSISSQGQTLAAKRQSTTTMQLNGSGGIGASTHRFGSAVSAARAAAVTVGDLDAGSASNYLSFMTQRAGAFAQYVIANTFDVFVLGR